MTSDRGPTFRMWPPVAIGGPLTLGLLLSSSVGDPLQASWVTRMVGWLLVDSFDERGYTGSTMRSIAAQAHVSVPTLELAFGTKGAVLKASIDVAIAGDDEELPILDRGWAAQARAATSVPDLLAIAVEMLGAAQARSAGLVLAVFEGSATDPGLATLAEQLVAQRESTAGWLVDCITALEALRPELTRRDAVETVWLLMDPAVFVRLTRHRHWSLHRYQRWVAAAIQHLLVPDPPTTAKSSEAHHEHR